MTDSAIFSFVYSSLSISLPATYFPCHYILYILSFDVTQAERGENLGENNRN